MKVRGFIKLFVLGGFLLSAFNYCPPGAQAASAETPACCHSKGECSHKTKGAANTRSCCTAERLAATRDHSKLTAPNLAAPLYLVVTGMTLPQVSSRRVSRSVAPAAGPPGRGPAALGSRAPPLA
jgi:hypothetical protein